MRFAHCIVAGLAVFAVGYRATAYTNTPDARPIALIYRMVPGQAQRYQLKADIKANIPVFDSPVPMALDALIDVTYVANPRTQLADGTADVDLEVEKASLEVGAPGTQKIPFPIELDQVREILNQRVTITKLGEVKKTKGGGDLPFGVSIPGVDPKRLYALLFPVVFQAQAVKPGDSWSFSSELLGGPGARPKFTATVLTADGLAPALRIRETFDMAVDQSVDADKKPLAAGKTAHRRKHGRIEGVGTLSFDPAIGLFTKSVVDIKANIADTLVGSPLSKDEPKEILSKVNARVTVELKPDKKPASSE